MNQTNSMKIVINLPSQILYLYQINNSNLELQKQYSISSGKNGNGCMEGSGKTPLGKHVIAEKIGNDKPANTVFIGRVPTGEIYSETLNKQAPKRDWILSRIMWLSGVEEGYNKGRNALGNCDTYQRYIYLHGTPDNEPMGTAISHGCIRMRNNDIIELYDLVDLNTEVEINDDNEKIISKSTGYQCY